MADIPGLRRFFRLKRRRDVDEEIRFHVETRIDDLVGLGASREDARRQALKEFGNLKRYREETTEIDQQSARAERVREWMRSVNVDVGYALRGFRRTPVFTVAALLTFAVGIGGNTAVWSILDALTRRTLPVSRPEELYMLGRTGLAD